ncbi:pyrroline-5-carboxylate reductase [Phaeovibrio sulfidiphilus]|uniref:Pyrroline-5-carboxylate reductase n=1 Tax=Phaeovibrio sulfidiphilus TaxID=1220600 RepID=A0A8J6YVD6_9PROT|nr:pyrroline-5-carboxylate reductase [Phaeovibrio sulfidiphilus]MBE1237094.1 pyrroline-5-carboxylate reductase [Phaeovibrio sulfidiphilus]
MTLSAERILLLGCGRMGRAMLDGWLNRGLDPSTVTVVDPMIDGSTLPDGVRLVSPADSVALDVDLCVVAVKPQVIDDILPAYMPLARRGTAFFSIVTGKSFETLETLLGGPASVIRCMPNTPVSVGKGVIALLANPRVSEALKTVTGSLMEAVGTVVWLDDESQMDAVTALSGSGPAYVFNLVEAMARAGVILGLPEELSMVLARETVVGAGALMDASPDSAATLRANVTSPGGTTAAALEVLMDTGTGLGPLLAKAMKAAADRSNELAS